MTLRRFMICFLSSFFFVSATAFAETAVIVHPSNDVGELSESQVKKIFLGKKKKFPNGTKVVPVSQVADSEVATKFNTQLLDKSDSQLKSYWSRLIFTGKGTPPKEVDSDVEVKTLVSVNPGMIGYIDAGAVDEKVKVVLKF